MKAENQKEQEGKKEEGAANSTNQRGATQKTTTTEEEIKWLKLARCKGIKDESKKILIEAYKDINLAWAELERTIKKDGFKGEVQIPTTAEVEKELEQIKNFGAKIIHANHSFYPKLLKKVFNAPNVLLAKGNLNLLNGVHFGVVGSRVPTALSLQFAKEISSSLVKEGFTIVSGLATGIDAAAHSVAIDMNKDGCGTVAVLGNGLGHIYPKENEGLHERIASGNGVIISEFEFNSTPTPSRFPRRNGTIAGTSYGTLVVEARKNSGSLITARYAHSYGREVYAVPGFPSDERYAGTNAIIKQNLAKMTTGIEDIMEDMRAIFGKDPSKIRESNQNEEFNLFEQDALEYQEELRSKEAETSEKELEKAKQTLLNLISTTPVAIEQLKACMPSFSTKSMLIALLELELEDAIERSFDGRVAIKTNKTKEEKQEMF